MNAANAITISTLQQYGFELKSLPMMQGVVMRRERQMGTRSGALPIPMNIDTSFLQYS
jgi:hypothetical protein